MNLTIVNNAAVARSYLSGAVTVAATVGATTSVTSTVQQLALSIDGAFKSDIFQNNIYITDGTNNYGVSDGIAYLSLIINFIGPNSDGIGNNLTSASIASVQRLATYLPSEGADGGTAPSWSVQIAGKDGSGNLQSVLTDTLGNQAVLVKDTSGNSINSQSGALNVNTKTPLVYSTPTTASVGTTSTLILAANSARLGLYLSNTSLQQISLGFDGHAAAYQYGITLFPGEKFWMDEYSFSTGAIYAITTGAATYIGVQEIT